MMTEAVIRNKPGMASIKDMPLLQDGPPPGGFPSVRYARRIQNTGPSAMAMFLTAFGAFSYGMYQVGKGNQIRSDLEFECFIYDECTQMKFRNNIPKLISQMSKHFLFHGALKEEKHLARQAFTSVLQAEEDERFVREWRRHVQYEAEVMKDVPGWRWTPPASAELRPSLVTLFLQPIP